jgi:hypothetical protein
VGRWEGGKMGRWQGGKVARWQGGKVARWQGGKVARWQGGKVRGKGNKLGEPRVHRMVRGCLSREGGRDTGVGRPSSI